MPLLSITVDQTLWQSERTGLMDALPEIRDMLCQKLGVSQAASHLTVTPVFGLQDQTLVNADLRVLGKEGRGPEMLAEVARALQAQLSATCGSHVSVRVTTMVPSAYLALR